MIFFHGPAHQLRALHTAAVIGKACRQRRKKRKIGQFFTLLPPGDGRKGMNADHSLLLNQIELQVQVRRTIRHRIQIRHGKNIGISAPGRGGRAGADGFLIKKSRLSQMHMHIAKAGEYSNFFILETLRPRK